MSHSRPRRCAISTRPSRKSKVRPRPPRKVAEGCGRGRAGDADLELGADLGIVGQAHGLHGNGRLPALPEDLPTLRACEKHAAGDLGAARPNLMAAGARPMVVGCQTTQTSTRSEHRHPPRSSDRRAVLVCERDRPLHCLLRSPMCSLPSHRLPRLSLHPMHAPREEFTLAGTRLSVSWCTADHAGRQSLARMPVIISSRSARKPGSCSPRSRASQVLSNTWHDEACSRADCPLARRH
jgi:hypothetical protein